MIITNKQQLRAYGTPYRIWQGIPAIAVTPGGRLFAAFYSGGTNEEIGNFVVLLRSDNRGITWSEPVAVVLRENARCFDECLWMDPLGRLWLTWSVLPGHGTYGSICENPDADEPVWGDEFFIGHDVMMNKPIVLSTGEWLFPIAVWGERVWSWMPEWRTEQSELGAFVYRTADQGKTFERLGGVIHPDHSFDEHMVLERKDGSLLMLTRTMGGIGCAESFDRGVSWSQPGDSGLGGPNSRFFISRLASGRILLINHVDFVGRDHLTALLSEDEGKTWPYRLLLDERSGVSYPDAAQDESGAIHIIYDRERGCDKRTLEIAQADAREILYTRIREEDILAGALVSSDSCMKQIVSKLGRYEGTDDPFARYPRHEQTARFAAAMEDDAALNRILTCFARDQRLLTDEEESQLQQLIAEFPTSADRVETLYQIAVLLKFAKRK